MIHRVSPADSVLSALESTYSPQHTLVTLFQNGHSEPHPSPYTSTISSHFPPLTLSHNPANQTLPLHTITNITKPPPKTFPTPLIFHLTRTSTSATMHWWRNTYSKLPDSTTSYDHTRTFSTPTTSYNQTATTTNNNTPSSDPLPRREMWQCCQCTFKRNHYNPHKGPRGAKCRKVFSSKEQEARRQRGDWEQNGCEHWGPCDDCLPHWERCWE